MVVVIGAVVVVLVVELVVVSASVVVIVEVVAPGLVVPEAPFVEVPVVAVSDVLIVAGFVISVVCIVTIDSDVAEFVAICPDDMVPVVVARTELVNILVVCFPVVGTCVCVKSGITVAVDTCMTFEVWKKAVLEMCVVVTDGNRDALVDIVLSVGKGVGVANGPVVDLGATVGAVVNKVSVGVGVGVGRDGVLLSADETVVGTELEY